MLEKLNELRIQIADILNINILDENLIFLDIWSLVHLIFGIGIMYILLKIKPLKFKLIYLFAILATFEIIEFFLYMNLTELFIKETLVNVFWDLAVGILGGAIMLGINYLKK